MGKVKTLVALPFNSPFEIGIRIVYLLSSLYPKGADLQKLILLDYATIYSGDFGGPVSLHTPVPFRSAELYSRREVVQSGLYLMSTKRMVEIQFDDEGITYIAGDNARVLVDSVNSSYFLNLNLRCEWTVSKFGQFSMINLTNLFHDLGIRWEAEIDDTVKRLE